MGEVALLLREYPHSEVGLEQMAYAIIALGGDTKVVMEATGRYHEPVAVPYASMESTSPFLIHCSYSAAAAAPSERSRQIRLMP